MFLNFGNLAYNLFIGIMFCFLNIILQNKHVAKILQDYCVSLLPHLSMPVRSSHITAEKFFRFFVSNWQQRNVFTNFKHDRVIRSNLINQFLFKKIYLLWLFPSIFINHLFSINLLSLAPQKIYNIQDLEWYINNW